MARSQSPLHIEPPRLSPVTGSPIGEALQGFGQSMLQFFMMKQQMELEERKLQLMEKEAKVREKSKTGSDQAQAAAFTQIAQQDPQMAAMMPQMAASQPQVGQQMLQALAGGQADPGMFNAGQPGGPAPLQVPGMQDISQFMPGGQPAFASNSALAAALQPMQEFRESQARLSATTAQAEQARAETDLKRQALSFQSRIQPIQLRLEQSRLSLTEQELSNAQQRIQLETRQFASSMVQDRLRAAAQYTAALAPLVGTVEAKATSNRLFFGTNDTPTANALLSDEVQNLTRTMAEVTDPAQLADFYEGQTRATFAQRLGLPGEAQQAADMALQQAGSPQKALQQLAESTALSTDQKAQLLPTVLAYYQMLNPSAKLTLPAKDKGLRQRIGEFMTMQRSDRTTTPRQGSPHGGVM